MQKISEMENDGIHLWVPESALFDNAPDCIDKFPDDPACLVFSNQYVLDLQKEIERLKEYEWKYNDLCK